MSDPVITRAPAGLVSGLTATAIVIADMVGIGVFTSLGFQVADITSGFSLLHAVGGRRRGRAVRRILLRRTGHHAAALERRVQFPAPASIIRRSASSPAGFRRPSASRRRSRSPPWRSASTSKRSRRTRRRLSLGLGRHLDRRARAALRASRSGSAFHNAWTACKLALIVVFIVAGFAFGDPQPISFAPNAWRSAHFERAVRHQPGVRDVFLFGLERRHLYRRRNARSGAQPAARAARRHRRSSSCSMSGSMPSSCDHAACRSSPARSTSP